MSKLNKQLIKAGLYYLIDHDEESFLERMSIYLQDRPQLMSFLFEGPLPINDTIKHKLEEYIKTTLPNSEYFVGISKISIGFDYDSQQQYQVVYEVDRFYDSNKRPWNGQAVKDDAHPISIITEFTINISPSNIKI